MSNSGAMEVSGALALTNGTAITNSAPADTITVAGTLTLDDTSAISGGTTTIDSSGTVTLNGNSELSDGTLNNSGQFTASGSGNALSNETVTNSGAVEVSGALTLSGTDTIIGNGTSTVDISGTLDIGTKSVSATLDIGGTVMLNGTGAITLENSADIISGASGGGTLRNDSAISGSGTIGDGSNDLTLVNDGTIEATGGLLFVDTSQTLTNAGLLQATGGGTLDIGSEIDNNGMLAVTDGTVNVRGSVSGTGLATTGDHGILDFQSSVAATQTITFTDATGTLALADPADFDATVNGAAGGALFTGDTIDLTNTTVTTVVWNGSTLSVNGEATAFQISELPSGDTFAFMSNSHGGTDLTVLPQALDFSSSAVTGVEDSAIPLGLSATLTAATLTTLVIGEIPAGATLSDADHNTLTVTSGSIVFTANEIAEGYLTGLAITPPNDANFSLSMMATATDGNGYNYTVPATEAVTSIRMRRRSRRWSGSR